jgi:hypothetical protein
MTSLQIKLGRFCENSNAAALAFSINGTEGFCVCEEPAGADAEGGGSGQGGRSCCLPRFKMGGASEQAGVLWDCESVAGGGAERDCAGCDCGGDAFWALREIGACRTRVSTIVLRQLDCELKLRRMMTLPKSYHADFAFSFHRQHTPRWLRLGMGLLVEGLWI